MHNPSKSSRLPCQILKALQALAVNPWASLPPQGTAPLGLFLTLLITACGRTPTAPAPEAGRCAFAPDSTPAAAATLGCLADYQALANHPLDLSLPGAFSVKTAIDRADGDRLYFLDTRTYRLHYDFASRHLSGNGRPQVPPISEFGVTEYYTPDRRFILGSLARYEGPGIWAWEMAPADNAGAEMIALAHRRIAEACFCGNDLYFHATSLAIEVEAAKLPASIKVLSTARLHAGIDYQPLHFATTLGRLTFPDPGLPARSALGPRDIAVLESAPDDLPAVAGLITQAFQTPLSHLNVLAQERGTPNMALRGARADKTLRALEGKWAKLTVGPFAYSVTEVTDAEAEAWWKDRPPAAPPLPGLDTATVDLRDVEDILDLDSLPLGEALRRAIPAFGGKAGHYAAFPHMDSAKVKYSPAFAIPVSHYRHHMRRHGLDDTVDRMLSDPRFATDPAERDRRLRSLREALVAAPLDSSLWARLEAKLEEKFPGGGRIRFRSSSNLEGLDGFTGAGLHEGRTVAKADPALTVQKALREVWAGLWELRAFEERARRGIDPLTVGMAILVQAEQPGDLANGLALTANPFDPPGYEPGFYVNVAPGEAPVARPERSAATDQFIHHYDIPGRPVVLLARFDPSPTGKPVLDPVQTDALGSALKEVHRFFQPLYGNAPFAWYAMETEFRLARPNGAAGAEAAIILGQVRPYKGWGKP